MGYFNYLKRLLEPTGLYDLVSGVGAAELEVIGGELDEVFEELEELVREALPLTAVGYGISFYERLLPYRPSYITEKDAQRALTALLRIRGGCFTQALLQSTLSGCGLTAEVTESERAQTVYVSFPQNRGIPEDFEKLKRKAEEILPFHLAVEYKFIYALWRELMEAFRTWGSIEARGLCWKELETYLPE